MSHHYAPVYSLGQDDASVILCLTLPHEWLGRFETRIKGGEFIFSLKPYRLCLRFHQPLADDERLSADYDFDRCELTLRLPKESQGQRFTLATQPRYGGESRASSCTNLSSEEVLEVDEEALMADSDGDEEDDDDDGAASHVPPAVAAAAVRRTPTSAGAALSVKHSRAPAANTLADMRAAGGGALQPVRRR